MQIVLQRKPGIIVYLSNQIPAQIVSIGDDGYPEIQSWLRQGNQIISAGVLPFEYVVQGIDSVSAYDYLFYAEKSSPGTERISQAYVTSMSGASSSTQFRTYQGIGNVTYTMKFGGQTTDDYVQLSACKPSDDGSITFVFAMALANVNCTSMYYQSFDVSVDGMTLFSRFTPDQLRYSKNGNAGSKVFYDNEVQDTHGNRLFMQHIQDATQTDGSVDADFLCYLTVREPLAKGNHVIEIRDRSDNLLSSGQDIRVLGLNNIIAWEQQYRSTTFREIQSQYQGVPETGAGVFLVTGKDVVVSADSLGRESFAIGSCINVEPTRTEYAVSLSKAYPFKTYGRDLSSQYGECTFRVGSGLFTMLDPVPIDGNALYTLAKLNYVLTGVIADWYNIAGTAAVNNFDTTTTGPTFVGLAVNPGVVTVNERLHEAVLPDQDFKYDGKYANSFSTQHPYPTVNATLDWSSGSSLYVNGSSAGSNGKFSVTLNDMDITQSAGYLVLDASFYNCRVSLNSSSASFGEIAEGVTALLIPAGTHHAVTILGTATGSGAYVELLWLSTSKVPSVQQPDQMCVNSFQTASQLAPVALESGDSYSVTGGVLSFNVRKDGSSDTDSVYVNITKVQDPRLVLEIRDKVNTTAFNGHTLKATVYSDYALQGKSQTIILTNATSLHHAEVPDSALSSRVNQTVG